MKAERERLKQKLDEELEAVEFTRQDEVIKRTHPRTWQDAVVSWWNKEIELPLVPIGIAASFLFALVTFNNLNGHTVEPPVIREQRQLVEVAGNTYWKDDYERAVAYSESKH
ncbi:hypothetical protein AB6A23_00635 [Paenibacillus tarimensis]